MGGCEYERREMSVIEMLQPLKRFDASYKENLLTWIYDYGSYLFVFDLSVKYIDLLNFYSLHMLSTNISRVYICIRIYRFIYRSLARGEKCGKRSVIIEMMHL